MKTSKFVNKTFTGWTCTEMYLNKNYGGGTKHNQYTYQLERRTSDGKMIKTITVPGNVMTKISQGKITVEEISEKYKKNNDKRLLYRFVD